MTDFLLSLQITALGMGLVFGAIILLWLMMILLTFFTAEKKTPDDEVSAPDSPEVSSSSRVTDLISLSGSKAQAAMVAVAIALAEQEQSTAHPLPEPPTTIVSAWQLGMRTSQRTQKGNLRRP
jgi:Na+-transporting methylmalonyl-CoA/oxaloacetate decarboxylase gamma subunit